MPSPPQRLDALSAPARLDTITRRLVDWTADHLPQFPWRGSRDPYVIWVAVVMLQQTQMATALPYYARFLQRFPTLASLAVAELDQVLKVWEGLGYYARARNLHAAARLLAERDGGRIPADRPHLLALPGVGAYTAGAILSIAFGAREPVVDGNVRRILCRLFAIADDPTRSATKRTLRDLAVLLLPHHGVGDFNQGLMHLGAVVCIPRKPDCHTCPLADLCKSRRLRIQAELPRAARRRVVPHYDAAAGIIWKDSDDQVLIAQRNLDDMLGGLWEFPGGRPEDGETLADCLRREIREELGVRIEVGRLVTRVRHAYSHFRITLHAFECRSVEGYPRALDCADWRWVRLGDLADFAFPVADQKVIAALLAERE